MKRCYGQICAIILFFCCSMLVVSSDNSLVAFKNPQLLTLQDRIDCQTIIEQVYWNHRIWQKENNRPKPLLSEVVPETMIKMKVDNYLRKTNALKEYWNYAITPSRLQAEMNRIAEHSRNSVMLHELWQGLNNDPALIAECLVRPLLADQQIRALYAFDSRFHGEARKLAESYLAKFKTIDAMPTLTGKKFELEIVKEKAGKENASDMEIPQPHQIHIMHMTEDGWDDFIKKLHKDFYGNVPAFLHSQPSMNDNNSLYAEIPVGRLSPLREDENRFYAVAVLKRENDVIRISEVEWSKVPFDIWWQQAKMNAGIRIDQPVYEYQLPDITAGSCINDTWTPTYVNPFGRYEHTAVWTGSEMILWGGQGNYTTNGLRYNPVTDTWASTTLAGAPTGRAYHSAVWTGTRMIIWGGYGCIDTNCNSVNNLGNGAIYNPAADTWGTMSSDNAPTARHDHTAIWAGSQMIVWGGYGCTDVLCTSVNVLDTGSRYNPDTDTWTPVNSTDAPAARQLHTAVWTGSVMIIWGGCSTSTCFGSQYNTGGRYNPASNSWQDVTLTNAPNGSIYHTAIWTGIEMMIWGGYEPYGLSNACHRYNPVTDTWTDGSITNSPSSRYDHTAVWTGTEMLIWGGQDTSNSSPINTGGRYNPSSDTWIAITTSNAPTGRNYPAAVWTGNEMIIWGGIPDSATGGRYNPASNSWTPTSSPGPAGYSPLMRYLHSAVWTGTEMIIWGGWNTKRTNTGARYDTALDSWTSTTLVNAPTARIYHTAVWAGDKMIIWAGAGPEYVNTGGLYNPIADAWSATSTTNAPIPRANHSAIWTGSEMIIWDGSMGYQTGGRYNPISDSWIPVNSSNAPSSREYHSAVWANNSMIVWGGRSSNNYLNTGGIYYPSTDTWTSTSITNAPEGRRYAPAVWTGTKMIVWGGRNATNSFNTGGLYDPVSGNWEATSLINAPTARYNHTAVWTGSAMIVWGGTADNSGARYYPSMNTWIATNRDNAPVPRNRHTAIWTGDEMIAWGGYPISDTGGMYCAAGPALYSHKPTVDDSGSTLPNSIIEPDETVNLIGTLQNVGTFPATSVTATLTTADPVNINNPNAIYTDMAPDAASVCTTCYSITAPLANRPSVHWDFTVKETSACSGCNPTGFDFVYHVGNSFADVAPSNIFYSSIEKLLHSGVTAGCNATHYCPLNSVARDQMAKLICASMEKTASGTCLPAGCTGIFADVPDSNVFCPYIEALYTAGIVSGCQASPLLYCPANLVQRQQMSKFICMAMEASIPGTCTVDACSGIFADVPSTNAFCPYIEKIYASGVVSGCQTSPLLYCPSNNVSREQMAKFLVNAFSFTF